MKNRFTLAFLVLLGLSALSVRAEFVKPETAAKFARGILGMDETPVPEKEVSMRAAGRDGEAVTPDYYVFNNPKGGWVIIAADDRVNPVIGYSHDGSFVTSGMPENLKWWMEGVTQTIDLIREQELEATPLAREVWNNVMKADDPGMDIKVIQTAEWGQGTPYNNYCPIVLSENMRSVTGCVATAMAIIARYNRWPEHGTGVIGGYETRSLKTYIPPYSIDSHYYDWDNMPLTDAAGRNSSWDQNQINEVAQIMHDCGVMVNMDYTNYYGSGTHTGKVAEAMKKNLSYSESAVFISRSSYSLDSWYSIIRNEIDEGRVVLYAGTGPSSGGHAFVCDGYDADGSMLRFNWGWKGSCNGFYTLDLDLTKKIKDCSFPDDQDAIIGLAPDTTKIEQTEKTMLTLVQAQDFYGIKPDYSENTISEGSELRFVIGWFQNNESVDLELEFKVCLEDKEGNVKQEGWPLSVKLPACNGYIYHERTDYTTLTVSPQLSDRFRLYIKDEDETWRVLPGNKDLLPDVDGVVCGVTPDPLIIVPDDCSAGQEITLSLSFGFTHVKSVTWTVNDTEINGNKVTLVQGKNAIRADVEYLDGTTGSLFKTLQLE
ncbi:MAG: C10 family peptidase [Bacteroidaceae bacterium]|nr:C10 family peptidase [Bacteroidaceae bacterium]